MGLAGALPRGGRRHIVARQQRWELAQLKVQEWIQAVFAWIGITDPLAVSVGVGVVVGVALAMVLTVVVRLILFVVSSAVGFRR
jgi:predicted anti-sigma-YlaC factor YlaD